MGDIFIFFFSKLASFVILSTWLCKRLIMRCLLCVFLLFAAAYMYHYDAHLYNIPANLNEAVRGA